MSAVSLTTDGHQRSYGVALWHSQMRHPVQDRTAHQHLRRLSVEAACPDSLTEDHLQPEHHRLGQRASMIMALSLPLGASMTANAAHVLVARVPLLLAIAMLPDACAFLRRDDGTCAALSNRVITLAVIVTAIARHLREFRLDLRQQVSEQWLWYWSAPIPDT